MRRLPSFCAFISAFAFLIIGSRGQAQLRDATTSVLSPGAITAAPEGAEAVDINPAGLAFLDSWELSYVHAHAPDSARVRGAGDAVRVGVPLPLGLALGFSAQSVRPSAGTGELDRGQLALALAYAARGAGIGAAVRWFGSEDPALSGVTSMDLGFSLRPAPSLAVSLVARDLLAPLQVGARDLPGSFLLSTALRPFGTRDLTLDLGGALDTDGRVGLRGALDMVVPAVGRLVAAAEIAGLEDEAELTVTAGLAVDWGRMGAGGGVWFGDGFEQRPGWYLRARAGGAIRPGVPLPSYALDLPVRGSVGARRLVALVTELSRAMHDDRIGGVLLRLRNTSMGMASAQELRAMIRALREVGKPVVCHLDAATGSEFYACAAATRTWLDPAGGVRLWGTSGSVLLLGDLLQSAGVRADFVRIGRYKSAPEQLTNSQSSEGAREQRAALYDDAYGRLVADLGADFGLRRERVREIIDSGPYVTPELVDLELVADALDEYDMDEALADAFAARLPLREEPPTTISRRWGSSGKVGVVFVDGDIVDGDNVDIPFIGVHMSGGRTVVRAIEQLAADPSVRAIVVRVDSPGGSALASDQIWRALMRARRRKPVIASMGGIAASGGYYVASAAQEIWANPSTLTGSIGIFFGKVDFAPLADRLGISIEHIRRGQHAGMESLFRPFTAQERALLADKIRIWYRLFLARIAEGRGMERAAIDAVARGRVMSGDAALAHGLVDRLGGFAAALARARELADLGPDADLVVVPNRPANLLDYVLGSGSSGSAEGTPSVVIPDSLREAVQLVAAFGHLREGVPLARVEGGYNRLP